MSKNNTSETVSTETTEEVVSTETSEAPVSTETSETTVKTVLAGLYGDAALSDDKRGMSGSFGTRESSGFDRLDRSAKVAVKKAVQARFDRYMRDGQFVLSQPLWTVLSSLDGSAKVEKNVTESDVRAKMGEMVAMLRYAADALFAGSVPVVGFDGLVPILDESDIPELSDEMVEKAIKFANVSFGTKRKENDIPGLIAETYATWASGTFRTIAAIRNEIGQNHPELGVTSDWDGRLNAALFGKNWDATYIQPVSSGSPEARKADEKGRAGAIRTDADLPDNSDTPDGAAE